MKKKNRTKDEIKKGRFNCLILSHTQQNSDEMWMEIIIVIIVMIIWMLFFSFCAKKEEIFRISNINNQINKRNSVTEPALLMNKKRLFSMVLSGIVPSNQNRNWLQTEKKNINGKIHITHNGLIQFNSSGFVSLSWNGEKIAKHRIQVD